MENKKKPKLKKTTILILAVVGFFFLYFFSFKMSRGYIIHHAADDTTIMDIDNGGEKTKVQQEMENKRLNENKKSPMQRLKESKKAFISDDQVNDIKIEGSTLEDFKRAMSNFVKVRDVDEEFKPINKGKTNNNVQFETDFNYLVIKSGKKRECYKIPISEKKDFQNMYRRMIYTSVEFITNGRGIGDVKIYHGNEEKKVWFWKKKELINKILYKREVGKIQPEKEFTRVKDNYTIKVDKSGVVLSIQTMGKDFIKVTCGDNTAYYEVYPDLYNYLHDKEFK